MSPTFQNPTYCFKDGRQPNKATDPKENIEQAAYV
jgi:hypothetical protein